MDATTTHSMPLLIQQLKAAHPTVTFTEADSFSWAPHEQTIYYNEAIPDAEALLLHELSHALLDHRAYRRDVELLAMETAAWEKAAAYTVEHETTLDGLRLSIDDTVVQDHLDTYRDWLHARSTCPECSANGYQTDTQHYSCPACAHTWRVNEARLCALRRYGTS